MNARERLNEIIEFGVRDYKSEYANYHSSPKQKERRAGRNAARDKMEKAGRVHKGDGKDVDHKDRNTGNNSPSNLRVASKAKNRSMNMSARGRLGEIKEFSILAALGVGAAAHVGLNAFIKRMMKPGTMASRMGASIIKKGIDDKAAGKMIHPMVTNASNAMLGPEFSHMYAHAGHIKGPFLKHINSVPSGQLGHVGESARALVGGPTSKWTDRFLNLMPRVKADRAPRFYDHVGTATGGLVAGAIDPALPIINIGRTAVANSSMGQKVISNMVKKGETHGAPAGFKREAMDYLASPSLNIARDVGEELGRQKASPLGRIAAQRAGELKSAQLASKEPATKRARMLMR